MLYQMGTQRIEVIVRKEGGGGEQGTKEKNADEATEEQEQSESGKGMSAKSREKSRMIRTNVTHGLAVAKQGIDTLINYKIQGIGMKYGDQSLQELVAREWEIIKDGTNFASSVSMGMLYGASGGPWGIFFGGLFGGLSSGFSLASKYAGREREFDYKQFKENTAIEYNRARASINLTTGRLR